MDPQPLTRQEADALTPGQLLERWSLEIRRWTGGDDYAIVDSAGVVLGFVGSLADVRGWMAQPQVGMIVDQPGGKLTAEELMRALRAEWGDRGAIVAEEAEEGYVVELWRGRQGNVSAFWINSACKRYSLAKALAFATGAA